MRNWRPMWMSRLNLVVVRVLLLLLGHLMREMLT